MQTVTHGSLFSGSGGFDQAARMVGMESAWQSEIEPYPIRVLKKNFPDAVQLGDIQRINGAKIEAVDVISGGSPCQDMSVAGKRSGLDGERSTLFHQQIRIVKEMREATNGEKPRFMVWENVPGAFSSNGGEDFRNVLEEIIGISEPGVHVPRPGKKGSRWAYAGAIMGDGYSVAWRVMDAQYWGVPQRRRRIYLVADFGGTSAPEILFKCKGVSWNPSEGRNQRKEAARDFEEGAGEAGRSLYGGAVPIENHSQDSRVGISPDGICQTLTGKMGTGGGNVPLLLDAVAVRERAGCDGGGKGALIQEEISGTLKQVNDQAVFQPKAFGIGSYFSGGMLSDNPEVGFYEAKTSRTIDTSGGDPTRHQGGIAVVAFEPGAASRVGNHVWDDGKTGALRARAGDNQQAVVIPIEGNGARPSHSGAGFCESDKMYTLNATEQHAVAYAVGRDNTTAWEEKAQALTSEEVPGSVAHPVFPEISGTLTAKMAKGTGGPAGDECQNLVLDYIVRRLTPLECCRLQGFPDDWTDSLPAGDSNAEIRFWMDVWLEHWALVDRGNGVKRPKDEKAVRRWLAGDPSDSDQYKLWGNGLALPCAYFVFQGIKEVLDGSAV